MAKELPYFKWYPADAESDEKYSSFSDAELGFYHRCLNRSWINNGLPTDQNALARLLKTTVRYIEKMWKTVGQCFYVDGDRYRNRRQEAERSKARTKSESATNSVRTRYERRTNDLPRALARPESESVSESVSFGEGELGKGDGEVIKRTPVNDPLWFEFKNSCGINGIRGSDTDWIESEMEWGRLDNHQRLQALEGTSKDLIGKQNCTPQGYLRKRMWQRGERVQAFPAQRSRGEQSTIEAFESFVQHKRP